MRHATWGVEKVTPDAVWLYDECEPYCVSITNDAEYVTMELFREYGNKRFFYFDSMDELTELIHDHGRFEAFDMIDTPHPCMYNK